MDYIWKKKPLASAMGSHFSLLPYVPTHRPLATGFVNIPLHSKQPKTSLSHSNASGYSLQSNTNS